jgi:hypothetical protein
VYLSLCSDEVADWEYAASNDIHTAKLAGEEGNKSELWEFKVFHWTDSEKPRQTSVRTVGFTGPTSNYRSADKSLARPTFRYILFDGENISFDASLVIYINSTNIPPIIIINRIYEHQNLMSL